MESVSNFLDACPAVPCLVLFIWCFCMIYLVCLKIYLSSPKPGHPSGETGRCGAKRSGAGCLSFFFEIYGVSRKTNKKHSTTYYFPKVSLRNILAKAPIWTARRSGRGVPLSGQPTQMSLTSLWKHEQLKPYVNRRRNKTRGWQPVHNRFISETRPLFVPGCWLVDRRLFVFANPSHPKDVREIKRRNTVSTVFCCCPLNRMVTNTRC